jgi:hypothetical protein
MLGIKNLLLLKQSHALDTRSGNHLEEQCSNYEKVLRELGEDLETPCLPLPCMPSPHPRVRDNGVIQSSLLLLVLVVLFLVVTNKLSMDLSSGINFEDILVKHEND